MSLSNDLISQFVKVTNDNKNSKCETTVYGTIKEVSNTLYVQLDGSDQLIPIAKYEVGEAGDRDVTAYLNSTAIDLRAAKEGDRVTIMIKNHSVVVTGNLSDPSASSNDSRLKIGEDVFDRVSAIEVDNVKINDRLDVNQILVDEIKADNATINEKLEAAEIAVNDLEADNATINEKLTAAEAEIETLKSGSIDTDVLDARYATIENLNATNEDVYNLNASHAEFKEATAQRLEAAEAIIDDLDATYAKITDLEAAEGRIDILESDVAAIDNIIFKGATGDTIHTNFSNSVIAQLGDAQIKSAMIYDVSANKISAGTLSTNKVTIASDDGGMKITDGTIQILDGTDVRIQIGKDANGNYSIIICDADGNTMLDADGLTEDGIKDAIIRNDMVSETANIAASKLNIDSLFEVINNSSNTIKSTQIYVDDEGQTLSVAFKSLTTTVDDISTDVGNLQNEVSSQGTQITAIQGQIASKVWQQDIDSATDTMSTHYSELQQEVDGISATVASHTTQISEKADNSTVTTIDNKVTSIESDLSGFKTTVSNTYATKTALSATDTKAANAATAAKNAQSDVDTLEDRVSTAESTIEQHTDAIALRATKTEVSTAKSEAISAASADATTKANNAVTSANANTANVLKSYSTTEQMNSAIELKADSITSSVSSTYYTKSEATSDKNSMYDQMQTYYSENQQLISDVNDYAASIEADLNSLEIGGRNYVLNSDEEMVISTYYALYELSDAKSALQDKSVVVSFDAKRPEDGKAVNVYAYFRGSSPLKPNSEYLGDVTHEYKRYYVIIEPGAVIDDATHIAIHSSINASGMSVRNVKVEVGTLATDWTPAPEDVDGDITALTTRMTSAETTISQNTEAIELRATHTEVVTAKAEAISSANNNTETLLANYSTTSEMESAIQLESDSIISSVSSTYATISDLSTTNDNVSVAQETADAAQASINNLAVGGRNYLSDSEYERVGSIDLFDFNLTKDITWLKTKEGKTVVFSFEAKGNEECTYQIDAYFRGNVNTYNANNPVHNLTAEYARYSQIMTIPTITNDDTEVMIRIRGNQYVGDRTNTGNFYIRNAKLEFGNIATDWTPAPEDIESDITDLDSRVTSAESSITQLSNKITANVTETTNLGTRMTTVEQTASGLTTRITSAETNISTAQSTANTAKTNASTAQSTANTARTEAANAAKTATNYLGFNGSGLVVGDMTADTLGKNVLIDTDSVDIRNSDTVLASFGANEVILGQNAEDSVINLCDGAGTIKALVSESSTSYPKYDSMQIDSQKIVMNGRVVNVDTTGSGDSYENTADMQLYTYTSAGSASAVLRATTLTKSSNDKNQTGVLASTSSNSVSTYTKIYSEAWDESASAWTSNAISVYPTRTQFSKYISINGNKITGANNILWSGGMYFTSGHTATLSAAVSDQTNGIVLVFSEYYDGEVKNQSYHTRFVPKQLVVDHGAAGHVFQLSTSNLAYFATKYLYISNTKITGHDNNDDTGTTTVGITRTNNRFVLRYVIGV